MKIDVVIGANYGDEGKGLVTNYLSSYNNGSKGLIVLNNGGAQRGHTVETADGFRHVFHHFGSTINPNYDSCCSEDFIINPAIWIKERAELNTLGLNPKLYIHPECKVSTVFDMLLNQMIETYRGKNNHGSVGVGIWETICRHNKIPITFETSILSLATNKFKNQLINYFYKKIEEYNISDAIKNDFLNGIDIDGLFGHWLYDFNQMKKSCFKFIGFEITGYTLAKEYQHVIFENGQGLLLDQNIDKIYSTPSNTGIDNALNFITKYYLNTAPINCYYVSRCYLTKHGAGPFEGELTNDEKQLYIPDYQQDQTNLYNDFQQNLRFGRLNESELINRIKTDFKKIDMNKFNRFSTCNLVLTHINEVKYNYINICDCWNSKMKNINNKFFISDSKFSNSIVQF